MEGDGDDVIIIEQLHGGVTIGRGAPTLFTAITSPAVKRVNAKTNTGHVGRSSIKHIIPPHVTYRAQVNLTTVNHTLLECGYINAMSKDTRYFAQTLRKYPLPKSQAKSSDLIQRKIRAENKTAPTNRKIASKKRNLRKTASHQAIKSNVLFECNVQETQRLNKVEEILPTITRVDNNSVNEVVDYNYNYLDFKTQISEIDVRYCTNTKRSCTCRRIKNVACDKHRKPSCHCNVCQASREANSTSRSSPSEYINRHEQEKEVQLQSRVYLESSCDEFDFEKEIIQWTNAKLKFQDDLVPIKLAQKLAKALGGKSKDKVLLPEARHEVVKYLTALSIIGPGIKDHLENYTDDLLKHLTISLKKTKSLNYLETNKSDNIEKISLNKTDDNKLKFFIKQFLNQLPVKKHKTKDQLNILADSFLKVLQEHDIKQIDLVDSHIADQYEDKNYYLNRILNWYNSIPELKQKLRVPFYDNLIHFQDLANILFEMIKSFDVQENIDKIKVDDVVMQWLKSYLNLHHVTQTESFKENLKNKLVTKILAPDKEYYNGLSEKDWITKKIYSLFKNMNHKITQNSEALELVNSLVFHLSYIKEKNKGNLTLNQCKNELRSWFAYLKEKHNIYFHEKEKTKLNNQILSLVKVSLRHEKHKKCNHVKQLKLLTNAILEEINRSSIHNLLNISQEKLLSLITDVISLVFEIYVKEKLILNSILYEKVCIVLHFILNLSADDIKGLVKSMLDKVTNTWKHVTLNNLKENTKVETNELKKKYSSKEVHKTQFVTSTPIDSEKELESNFNVNSKSFSNLINYNFLQKVIKDWLEENQLHFNETEKQNILQLITSDIDSRYNYAKAFSKTPSDLEEIEYFKYIIYKVLENYVKDQDLTNINTMISKLHETIDKTYISAKILEGVEVENQVPLEVLKTKLVNAFMNLNSYLVDEIFKNEYKGKLKEEINKFCSQYLQRVPATPLDTEQLHSNIYNALDNVPKRPLTKFENNVVTQIKSWLDELCKENNFPNNDNENIALDMVYSLLQNENNKSILYYNKDELSQTISQWVENYSKKQKFVVNGRYWTEKLIEKLKLLETPQDFNLSKETSAHMYTIPVESIETQFGTSIMPDEENNKIFVKELLTAEDKELLSKIRNRLSMRNDILKSQTDDVGDKPELELVPDVQVREYHWKSIEETQTSNNTLSLDDTDEPAQENIQPRGLDYKAQTMFNDDNKQTQTAQIAQLPAEIDELSAVSLPPRDLDYIKEAIKKTESIKQTQTSLCTLPPDEINKLTAVSLQPRGSDYKGQTTHKEAIEKKKSIELTQTFQNVLHLDEVNELTAVSPQPQDSENKARTISKKAFEQKESVEQKQTSQNAVQPDEIDRTTTESFQPHTLDHNFRKTKNDKDTIIPETSKNAKCKKNTCKLRKPNDERRRIELSKVVCPNKFTVKSKSFHKGLSCSCSNCQINKYRIKYLCKKSDNVNLQSCSKCFGGYCPFPSCVYFE